MSKITISVVFLLLIALLAATAFYWAWRDPHFTLTAVPQRLTMDPVGNALAVLALVGMLGILSLTLYRWQIGAAVSFTAGWWGIPILALAGLGIMVYLVSITETTICYPNGSCQVIQQSHYGRILGIPVGVLGVLGYLVILVTWSASLINSSRLLHFVPWSLLALTLLGVLFSLYFTFIEPFIIGATCPWCLTSAILMTLLFWLSAETVQSLRLHQALLDK